MHEEEIGSGGDVTPAERDVMREEPRPSRTTTSRARRRDEGDVTPAESDVMGEELGRSRATGRAKIEKNWRFASDPTKYDRDGHLRVRDHEKYNTA